MQRVVRFSPRSRPIFIVGGVLVCWALAFAPAAVDHPPSLAIQIAQVIGAGLVLGLGRQGWDVLLIRITAAALGFLLATAALDHQPPICVASVHCYQQSLSDALVVLTYVTVTLALIAIPTSLISRRSASVIWRETYVKPTATWQCQRRTSQPPALIPAFSAAVAQVLEPPTDEGPSGVPKKPG